MYKKILFITTGGTIASIQTDKGFSPSIKSDFFLDYIKEIQQFCNVTTKQVLNLDSTNIQPEHWVIIANAIKEDYNNYDGFVIAHGTDTLAYTASALSYLIQNPDKPIIITGSQKPISQSITDALKNLTDAFRLSITDNFNGIYVVFNGKVIVGTRARKVKTKSYNAFDSINFPVSAYINDKNIIKYFPQYNTNKKIKFYTKVVPSVFVLKLIPGIEPDLLDYVGEKYNAIIIESYGSGGLPFLDKRNFLERVTNLANRGKIIVMTTQVMHEGSDLDLYEVGKNVIDNIPILETYDMTLESVVTKLMWIMGQTSDFEIVKQLFYTRINEDIYWPL